VETGAASRPMLVVLPFANMGSHTPLPKILRLD
jgi:hypothetical protein